MTPVYLTIPTDPVTLIPLGMSADDFDLMMATIELWHDRITPKAYTPELDSEPQPAPTT